MRLSGIEQYLGGADNVAARSLIRGEQITYEGVVDNNGVAIDIADWTISAVAEYYTATVAITGSGSRATATVSELMDNSKADKVIAITKNDDTTTGKFSITLPEDLVDEADTANADASSGVILAAIYITYNSGGVTPTIRKSRMIVLVRHSA